MNDKNYPVNTWNDPASGCVVRFTWIEGSDLSRYEPYTQCYGVCFNENGQILIQRKDQDHDWCLPGGTVEAGESAEDTLRREFIEEVDAELKNVILLGGQCVQYIEGHNPHPEKGGDEFYQLRYFCEVENLLPQTPDPDNGEIRERMFVARDNIEEYINWADPGKAIFNQAREIWKKFHS